MKDQIIAKQKEIILYLFNFIKQGSIAYKVATKKMDELESLLQEQERKEPTVTIPKWQMVDIEDVLRQANNIHHSQKKETCFDRCICKAWKWTCNALGKEYSFEPVESVDQSGIREELITGFKETLKYHLKSIDEKREQTDTAYLRGEHDGVYYALEMIDKHLKSNQ